MQTLPVLKFGTVRCPHCRAEFDGHSATDGSGDHPTHGDVTMCIRCGQPSIFDAHDKCLRMPSTPELREFEENPHFRKVRSLILSDVIRRMAAAAKD